jgi:NADH-quinone oxidoreductase subunit L
LFFMTFTGAPRWQGASRHVDAHGAGDHAHDDAHGHGALSPHESPLTMLVPLGVLSLERCSPAWPSAAAFIGHGL